jgi:hypothetical protein
MSNALNSNLMATSPADDAFNTAPTANEVSHIDLDHVDFDVTDSKEVHQITFDEKTTSIKLSDIMKDKDDITYVYPSSVPTTAGFDLFDESKPFEPIYATSVLRVRGLDGLTDSENDKNYVRNVLVKELKFEEKDVLVERTLIRNYSKSVTVFMKAAPKYIRDRIKQFNRKKNVNKSRQNLEVELLDRSRNNLADSDNVAESRILYVSNFDILNQNCHRAFTKLFLRFGDLEKDIIVGVSKKNRDPFAKVTYKNIEDARMLWKYHNQNFDDDGKPTKITFGGKTLNIDYAKF